MKVKLLVINTIATKNNGIATIIYDFLNYMDKSCIDVDLVSAGKAQKEFVEKFQRTGVRVIEIPYRKADIKRYIKELYMLMRANHYDAVYVHGNSATMAVELMTAKICGCRVRLSHSHNSTCDAKRTDKLLRPLFYRLYTKAIACSGAAGDWLYPGREYVLINNGRSIDKYKFNVQKREKVRKQLGLSEGTLAIGHVGLFNKQKNHEFLINVFEEIKKRRQDAVLFLVGRGKKEDEIKQLASSLGIDRDIVFLGNRDDVEDILQAMDVMVLPSLYEGLPLVVVEWQISGLPCVISDAVTKECAYTDLIRFASLDAPYSQWADMVLSADTGSREKNSSEAARLTRESGFDIEGEANKLLEIILGEVNQKRT